MENCEKCSRQFGYEPCLMPDGRELFVPRECPECAEIRQSEVITQHRAEAAARQEARWHAICPPLYRDTDPARIPATFRAVVERWQFGPRGLGFIGQAGECKTRSAFLILHGQHLAGNRPSAASATKVSVWSQNRFSDDPERKAESYRKLDEIRFAPVILIDDLGKSKMTPRAEEEFFDILEHRTSHKLPTIWTANASGKELLAMMSPDRGGPIMRRLAEFSEIVTTK